MILLRYILCVVLSYLIGSLSASILISKYVYHRDVRRSGSGNAGAANTARVFGFGAGLLTFSGDFLKGIVSMLLCRAIAGEIGMVIGGAACLLGHCFPVYFHFRGGKAVATGAAVALMLDWRVFLLAAGLYLIGALATRTASLASLCAALGVPLGSILFALPLQRKLLALFTFLLVLAMHRSNIVRVLHGTEPRFSLGKRPKK